MRPFVAILIALALALIPTSSAHGGLVINEFDTYAISDFEGQEDSFAWEGFEIWDIYAGDGYSQSHESHGIYFKANFAGDGSARPTGSETWELQFTWMLGGEEFVRNIVQSSTEITTDFEEFESQVADGNVLQVRAWSPVTEWEGQSISEIVVLSSVDGEPRDIAPGGVYDPATGQEVPVTGPATPAFPAIGEGRIVEEVPLTGAAKFLDVEMDDLGEGAFEFTITNPLAEQGQHFMFRSLPPAGWNVAGAPAPVSLEGGASTTFTVQLSNDVALGTVEPFQLDLMTDVGGKQTMYAYLHGVDVAVVDDQALAHTATIEAPAEDAPGLPVVLGLLAMLFVARRRA